MTNDVGGYYYHRTDHTRLGRPEFQGLDMMARGILFTLRVMAGQSRQRHGYADGSLAYGEIKRLKIADLVEVIAGTPGMDRRKSRTGCDRLKRAGFLCVSRTGYVTIADWEEEQDAPPTASAGRKRNQRERERLTQARDGLSGFAGRDMSHEDLLRAVVVLSSVRRKTAEGIIRGLLAAGDIVQKADDQYMLPNTLSPNNGARPVPLSPPSSSDSEGIESERDMSHPAGVTCHIDRRVERKEEYIPKPNSKEIPISSGGERGTGRLPAGAVTQEQIFSDPDPIRVAMDFFGVSDDMNRNVWRKRLRDLQSARGVDDGDRCFRDALNETRTDKISGRPGGNWTRIFTSKLNKLIERTPTPQRAIA